MDPELDRLTLREREVLRLIARGYQYKDIALRLSISHKTVEAHVSAVLRKLQLSNRHELSRWAVERRLVRSRPTVCTHGPGPGCQRRLRSFGHAGCEKPPMRKRCAGLRWAREGRLP